MKRIYFLCAAAFFAVTLLLTGCGNGGDNSNDTKDDTDVERPSDVTGLTVTDEGDEYVTLSWNAATDNVGVAGYRITVDELSETRDVGNVTSYTWSDLVNGTTYTFSVVACDAAGNTSANPATVTGTPWDPDEGPPSDVTDPGGTGGWHDPVGRDYVKLRIWWTGSSNTDISHYLLSISNDGGSTYAILSDFNIGNIHALTVPDPAGPVTDSDLTPNDPFSIGTTYTLRVVAVDTSGLQSGGVTFPVTPTECQWPMGRGNPGLTGVSPDCSVKPPFRLRWAVRTPGVTFKSEPCVAADKIFVTLIDGPIIAYDAHTGTQCWARMDFATIYERYTPSCDGTRVFLRQNYYEPEIHALDVNSGETLWKYDASLVETNYSTTEQTPVFADGKVFFFRMDADGAFAVALNTVDGTEVWDTKIGDPGWYIKEPCYADGMVYLRASSNEAGCVVGLNATDGTIVWQRDDFPVTARFKTAACSSDGQIVCCPGDAVDPQILDAKTGATIWTGVEMQWSPVITDDVVVGGNFGGSPSFDVYDKATGEKLWRFCRGGASNCSVPVLTDLFAYMGMGTPNTGWRFGSGERYAVSTLGAVGMTSRDVEWGYRLFGNACSNPTIAYGRLYMCGAGWLYCFEPVLEAPPPPPEPDLAEIHIWKTSDLTFPDPGRGASYEGEDKAVGGESWPMYGGCPERCGLEVAITTPIEFAWTFDTGDEIHCSAAIHEGTVYVGSDNGKVYALDLATGTKIWEYSTGGKVRCSPAVADGVVVFGSDDHTFYALDAGTGVKKWKFVTGDIVRAAPAIVGDKVVFGSWDHCVYALNMTDGTQAWKYATSHSINAAPAVYDGRVFVGGGDWVLYALDMNTGSLDWHFIWRNASGVAVYRDMVTMLSSGGNMFYLCPEDGTPAMKFVGNADGAAFGTPAFSGDWLFFGRWYSRYGWGDTTGGVGIVNVKESKGYYPWYQSGGKGCLETPLTTANIMIIATITGTVEAYDIYDGVHANRQVWEWTTPSGKPFEAAPAAAGNHIVVGNTDGSVYAFTY